MCIKCKIYNVKTSLVSLSSIYDNMVGEKKMRYSLSWDLHSFPAVSYTGASDIQEQVISDWLLRSGKLVRCDKLKKEIVEQNLRVLINRYFSMFTCRLVGKKTFEISHQQCSQNEEIMKPGLEGVGYAYFRQPVNTTKTTRISPSSQQIFKVDFF